MKKSIAVLLAGLSFATVCLSSCKGAKSREGNKAETLLNYDENASDRMDIWAYYPDNTDAGMQLLKECGVNVAIATRDGEYNTTKPNAVKNLIELAGKHGINVFPFTGHIGLDSDKCLDIDWLHDYDNIEGVYMYDEPYPDMIDNIADRVPFFEENFKGKKFVSALHPSTCVSANGWPVDVNYEQYVESYCTKVLDKMSKDAYKLLMADVYPIIASGKSKEIKVSHLYNLSVLATSAKDHGAHTNLAIQTLDHMHYTVPEVADVRFQVYSALAFGFDGYTLYTFDTRPSTEKEENRLGLVQNGEKTVIYDRVKTVNDEVLAFDHVYKAFDWKGIIPVSVTKENSSAYSLLERSGKYVLAQESSIVLKGIETNNNILCGVFEDKNKNEGFMIMNYACSGSPCTAEINLSLIDCNKAIVYMNGEKKVID
ncbi:MAG: hypothetical protein IKA99_00385, partial [Clostridia bacterium]|nr:hypothetical protein [Clostridia bacterium]